MMATEQAHGLQKFAMIMDGGLGTMLEETCKTQVAGTSLWSAEALVKEPEAIVEAHLAFMRAGAEIIETSTYQCSFDTFQQAGYSRNDAWHLMRQAVLLAQRARTIFNQERGTDTDKPQVRLCLSLGPFGASLTPTQEFGGFYPPPYGPQGYSPDTPNISWMDDKEAEDEAIEALTAFHTERLSLFTQDSELWSYIDMVAFETVPLAREAISIRRTMARLEENGIGGRKQWWISFVFPDGRCPQMSDVNGARLSTSTLVRTVLSPEVYERYGRRKIPIPDGIGINCTGVEHLPRLVEEFEQVIVELKEEKKHFLVLYPNGGDVFDEASGAWKRSDEGTKNQWTIQMVDLVSQILGSSDVKWSGVVAGGCCRCDAEQICRLSKKLK